MGPRGAARSLVASHTRRPAQAPIALGALLTRDSREARLARSPCHAKRTRDSRCGDGRCKISTEGTERRIRGG